MIFFLHKFSFKIWSGGENSSPVEVAGRVGRFLQWLGRGQQGRALVKDWLEEELLM